MADLVITPTNVAPVLGSNILYKLVGSEHPLAGAAISAGETCYIDSADNLAKLASATDETQAAEMLIALNTAAINQAVYLARSGIIKLGATLVPGQFYWLSENAGKISDTGPAAGRYVSIIGYALDAAQLKFSPVITGLAFG